MYEDHWNIFTPHLIRYIVVVSELMACHYTAYGSVITSVILS